MQGIYNLERLQNQGAGSPKQGDFMSSHFTIGVLSARTGCTPDTIRYPTPWAASVAWANHIAALAREAAA